MRLQALKPARAGVDCRPIVVSASSRCRFECARPHLRGVCSEPQMDCRLHLRVDSGRLALWGRCHRSVLTPGGRLIDECRDAAQLLTDALVMRSGAEASLTRCCITPLSGRQIHQRAFQKLMADHGVTCSMSRSGNVWDNATTRELLLVTEDRAYRAQDLSVARRWQGLTCSTTSNASTIAKRRHSSIGYRSPLKYETQAGSA